MAEFFFSPKMSPGFRGYPNYNSFSYYHSYGNEWENPIKYNSNYRYNNPYSPNGYNYNYNNWKNGWSNQNTNLNGELQEHPIPSRQAIYVGNEQDYFLLGLPLIPAAFGTIVAFILSTSKKGRGIEAETYSHSYNMGFSAPAVVAYSIFSLIGITFFIIKGREKAHVQKRRYSAFLFTGVGLGAAILYFAAVYNFVYTLDRSSYAGNIIVKNFLTQIYSFIYFSLSTVTLIGFGDIVPVTLLTRTLVILEALFGFFIIVNGASLFINP